MMIYENSKLKITSKDESIYIQVYETGTTTFDISELLLRLPQIKLQSFLTLHRALEKADGTLTKIGKLKPAVELEVSKDQMSAYIIVNLPKDKFKAFQKEIAAQVLKLLDENGVTTGIIPDTLGNEFESGKKLLVAQGRPAVNGENAKYKYFKLSDKRPKMDNLGAVDHYDLQLIDNVKKDDWLGEKIPATSGTKGFTVKGKILPPKAGRDHVLRFDQKSIYSIFEGDKEVLRAKFDGAVRITEGKIAIDQHLHIRGDVDYSTGNIIFDGFVTIDGTVQDKFTVQATKDIEIKSDLGIGAVARIESTGGSIYVRGGINGKREGLIIASQNIYAKFSNEAVMIAGNQVHIGFYSMNSVIRAAEIIVDPVKGRIIGGEIYATHKISSGSIGNSLESKTRLNVEGFEREQINVELDARRIQLDETISKANRLREQLEEFEKQMETLDIERQTAYRGILFSYENTLDEILRIKREIEKLERMLQTRGEGEIKILKTIYPRTILEIKHMRKYIGTLTKSSFYAENQELHTALD